MLKRVIGITFSLIITAVIGFMSFGIWSVNSSKPVFETGGYILQSEEEGVKQLEFSAQTEYTLSRLGYINFKDTTGEPSTVAQETFVHLEDNSVMALTGGVLFDFNDLSENFINNYYISEKLIIQNVNGGYVAQTTTGEIEFGENLWKLSNNTYLIQSPFLTIHFSEEDSREVKDYVQVSVSEDGIVTLLTEDNRWSTISENCVIETEGGVKINPVTQLVNNDDYKMSLAKLSVDVDENIVLTESETRRQIVPELQIEAEDGESGTDGTDGVAGVNGESGEDGESGTSGTSGENGEEATDGTSGDVGTDGSKGSFGGSGAAGPAAVGNSSTNSALPSFNITNKDISATSIAGTVYITDESGFLELGAEYKMTMKIYGEDLVTPITCYVADYKDGSYTPASGMKTNFNTGALYSDSEFHFTTEVGALTPNKEYTLVLEGYYKVDDQGKEIYSRRFINTVFYTDTTGVFLNEKVTEQNSITIQSSISDEYKDKINSVEVVLLTPAQANSYDANSTSGFIYKYKLDYKANTTTGFEADQASGTDLATLPTQNQLLQFNNLTHNTEYIARVKVNMANDNGSTIDTLSDQKLSVTTLKRPIAWDSKAEVVATYNRVTGQVDVFRPTIIDPDGCIKEYVYIPYKVDDANPNMLTALPEYSKTMDPNSTGCMSFTLEPGTYKFEIVAKTYNNDKFVDYNIGMSDSAVIKKGSLPGLDLATTNVEYNQFEGTLTIRQPEGTEFKIAPGQPLTLEIKAEGLNPREIAFESTGLKSENNLYTATLTNLADTAGGEKVYEIPLKLLNLFQQTTYTIRVTSYLKFEGTDEEFVKYELGTRTFITPATSQITAKAVENPLGTAGASFNSIFTLDCAAPELDPVQLVSTQERLINGQVKLELRSEGKTLPYGVLNLTNTDTLREVYTGDGVALTPSDFNVDGDLPEGLKYFIRVAEVADESYALESKLGYYNTFNNVIGKDLDVKVTEGLPELTANPSNAISAVPILKKNAANYGIQGDAEIIKDLPDDAVIGYELDSTFDNRTRIGQTLTYYAFEYKVAHSLLKNTTTSFDISDEKSPLKPINTFTIDITSAEEIPTVAVIFGNAPDGGKNGEQVATGVDGQKVFYSGDVFIENAVSGEITSGMGRGYKYLFAYTAQVTEVGSDNTSNLLTYPVASVADYAKKISLGTGITLDNGAKLGANITYMLNSGLCDVPMIKPEIYTYVYDTQKVQEAAGVTNGEIVLHYTYRDLDDVIYDVDGSAKTKVTYRNNVTGEDVVEDVAKNKVATSGWYSLTMQYQVDYFNDKSQSLEPYFDYSLYKMIYDEEMEDLYGPQIPEVYYLTKIPVEWYWGSSAAPFSGVQFLASDKHLDENYFEFMFNDEDKAVNLLGRTYGALLKFTVLDDAGNATSTTKSIWSGMVLNETGSTRVAKVSTGALGDAFKGHKIQVTADIYYDNGLQGWKILDDKQQFALQTPIVSQDGATIPQLGAYYGTKGALLSSMYALAVQSGNNFVTTESLRNNITTQYGVTGDNIAYEGLYTKFFCTDIGELDDHRAIRPTIDGIGDKNDSLILVPKGASVYNATTTPLEVSFTSVTPTVASTTGFRASASTITFSSFNVESFDSIATNANGEREIIAKVYYEDPRNIGKPDLDNELTTAGGNNVLVLDSNGKYIADIANDLQFANPPSGMSLYEQGPFYMVFTAKDVNDNVITLMDASTSQTYQRPVYFTDTIRIEDYDHEINGLGVKYKNSSYFDKQLLYSFTVTNTNIEKVEYSIVKNKNGATGVPADLTDCETVLSHQDIKDNKMIADQYYTLTSRTDLSVKISPDEYREKIKTGIEHYILVKVWDANSTATEPSSYKFSPVFTLATPSTSQAVINVINKEYDDLTFNVTIVDPQRSFMGSTATAAADGGLYAVRITDKDDTLVRAGYLSDNLFPAKTNLLEFNIKDMQEYDNVAVNYLVADEKYNVYVYAVQDTDFDSLSDATSTKYSKTEGYSEKDFNFYFDKNNITSSGIKFNKLVDGAWDATIGGSKVKDNFDDIENDFLIGMTTVTTTEKDVINLGSPSFKYDSDTKRVKLVLTGATGLIDDNGESIFRDIDWSITGKDNKGIEVNAGAVEKENLFQKVETVFGYNYEFVLPTENILSGNYQIIVKLNYKDETKASERIDGVTLEN